MSYYERRNLVPGRIALVIMFLAYCAISAGMYFMVPEEGRRQVLGQSIVSSLWTAVLLGCIWCQQNWARYVLGGLILLGLVFALVPLMEVMEEGLPIPGILIVYLIVNVAILLALVYLPAIRELTRKRH